MQEGSKSLDMLKDLQFGRETFTLRNRMYQENNEAIKIAPKRNNSFETSPYVIQKHHAMRQFDFSLKIPN